VTSEEFQTFFEQFGEVIDSIVMFDRATSRSRGFGFVTFEDPAVCMHLLSMGHDDGTTFESRPTGRLEMRGKMIEVKSAQPKPSSRGRHTAEGKVAHPEQGDGADAPAWQPWQPYAAAPGVYDYHQASGPYYAPPPYYPYYPVYYPSPVPSQPPSPPLVPQAQAAAPEPQVNHYYLPPEQAPQGGAWGMPDGPAAPAAFALPASYPVVYYAPPPSYQASVMQPVAPGIPGKEGGEGEEAASS
jgi:RNA-binding protein Musashi